MLRRLHGVQFWAHEKVMRRVVRSAWLGEEPGDLSTLVNPESLQAIREARHS